jgi:hypothetical protein
MRAVLLASATVASSLRFLAIIRWNQSLLSSCGAFPSLFDWVCPGLNVHKRSQAFLRSDNSCALA